MDSTELRRHVTPGQRAMGYAMRHPEPEKGGRGKKKLPVSGEFSGVPTQRVSEARTVLAYSRGVAEQVVHWRKTVSDWLDMPNAKDGKGRNDNRVKLEPEDKAEILERVDAGEPQEQVAADLHNVTHNACTLLAMAQPAHND